MRRHSWRWRDIGGGRVFTLEVWKIDQVIEVRLLFYPYYYFYVAIHYILWSSTGFRVGKITRVRKIRKFGKLKSVRNVSVFKSIGKFKSVKVDQKIQMSQTLTSTVLDAIILLLMITILWSITRIDTHACYDELGINK